MAIERKNLPPPPGLIASLGAGFNAIANHVWVICLPIALDLFLWLGPRLSLKNSVDSVLEQLLAVPALFGDSGLTNPELIQQAWSKLAEQFNLFSVLRTFPVGLSSLMSSRWPTGSPLGTPSVVNADSTLNPLAWLVMLLLLGWVLGSLYFFWVSSVSMKWQSKRSVVQSLKNSVILSVIWILLLFVLSLPVLLFFSILAVFSPLLMEIGMFLVTLLALWMILPVFFSPHGIFIYQQNALGALRNGLRMARLTLPTSGLFLFLSIIISQGLAFLWRTPPDSSWLTLVGIAGHAFISASLLAASFIYYRDMNSWLQIVLEHLKTQTTSARV